MIIISFHQYGSEKIEKLNLNEKVTEENENFKFVVIGSGPSGSVVSNELNKNFNGEVLVIEKGDYYDLPSTKHPGDEFKKKWYRGGLNSTYFPEMVAYSSGSCMGGGSEINSGLYHEPDEIFLNNWRDEFLTDSITLAENQAYIEKIRELVNYENNENSDFFSNFFQALDISSKGNSKLKRFISNDNIKNSMSKTLLKEYIENNGKVSLNTEVIRINFIENKWRLQIKSKNKKYNIYAENLFLCCGSIFTNQLLLKSRISKGMKKIIRHFNFHPMLKAVGIYEKNIQELNEDVVAIQNIDNYPNHIIGNATSSVQFILSSFHYNKKIRNFVKQYWKKMKIFHVTFSLGKGRIFNIPFFKNPLLLYRLNSNEKISMIKGYRELIKFIKKTKANSIIPIGNKKIDLIKYNYFNKYSNSLNTIKNLQMSSVHILGGVTMGEAKNCVANSYGKINENENLYVCDSSLINTKLLKNPQGTVMMLAYRNIDHFIKNYKSKG